MRRAAMMTILVVIVGTMTFLSMLAVQYTMFTNQSFEYAANYMEDTGFVALSTIDHVASIGYETYDEEKKRELGRWENIAGKCIHVDDIHLTMFMRIMKTGSTVLSTLLSELSSRNRYVLDLRRMKTNRENSNLVANEFVQYFNSFRKRTVHAAHGPYIDFESRGAPRPVYMTIMRDPIRRAVSQYNYVNFGDRGKWIHFTRGTTSSNKKNVKSFDDCIRDAIAMSSNANACLKYMNLQLRLICGTSSECYDEPPSRRTFETAKRNIEKDFLVVGLTEELSTSLRVMERALPNILEGLVSAYENMETKYLRYNPISSESHDDNGGAATSFSHKDYSNIPRDVFDFLKDTQALEIELYLYVRDRFHRYVDGTCTT